MIDNICQKCIKRFTCVGLQYNIYSHSYVCPHNLIKVVKDTKTEIVENIPISNGTES